MTTDNKPMDYSTNGVELVKQKRKMIEGTDAFNKIIESMKDSDLMKELNNVEFFPLNGKEFLTYLVNVYKGKTISTSDRSINSLRDEIEEYIQAFINFYRSFKPHIYHEKVYTTKYYEDIIDNLLKANTSSRIVKKVFNNSSSITSDRPFDVVIRHIKDDNNSLYVMMSEKDCENLINYVEYLEGYVKEMNVDMVEYEAVMDVIAKLKDERNDLIDFIKKYL